MNTALQQKRSDREEKNQGGPQLVSSSESRGYELLPWLPCHLTIEIPAARFTLSNLLALENGSIIETTYHQSSDLPLRVNGQIVGWTEFEVVGDRLAVRLTDLT